MKSLLKLFTVAAIVSCSIQSVSHASILVGTGSGVDTRDKINTIIGNYNSTFSANLELLQANPLFDKFDASNGNIVGQNGTLNPGDFLFFQEDEDPLGSAPDGKAFRANVPIFDASVSFEESDLGTDGFSIGKNVQGFEYTGSFGGGNPFYYVSKNANDFTLWLSTTTFNPVYMDDPDGGSTFGESTAGNGGGTDGTFDPLRNAVSHISFYANPEPSSFILLGLGMLTVMLVYYRQQKSPAVQAA